MSIKLGRNSSISIAKFILFSLIIVSTNCTKNVKIIERGYYFSRTFNNTNCIKIVSSSKLIKFNNSKKWRYKYSIEEDEKVLNLFKKNDTSSISLTDLGGYYRLDIGIYCYSKSLEDRSYINCLDSIDFNIGNW